MQLLKIFQFKGLYQNGSKTAIPSGVFRRFTNAFKDRSGKILPFGRGEVVGNNEATNMPTPLSGLSVAATQFKGGLLQLIQKESSTFAPATDLSAFRYTNENNVAFPIAQPYRDLVTSAVIGLEAHTSRMYKDSGNNTFASVFNKTMLCRGVNIEKYSANSVPSQANISESNLLSFDGERVREAGLPLPWNPVDSLGAGPHYIRTLYATIGTDGEPVFSGILQTRHTTNSAFTFLGGYTTPPTDYLTNRRPDAISADSLPTYRIQGDSFFNDQKYYDTKFIAGQTAGSPAFFGLQLVAGYPSMVRDEASRGLQPGDWLMFRIRYNTVTPSELNLTSDLLKFQIKTMGQNPSDTVVFEDKFQIFDYTTFGWVTKTFSEYWNNWSAGVRTNWINDCVSLSPFALSNVFQITAYSATANGNYLVNFCEPYCHFSSFSRLSIYTTTVTVFKYFNFMGVMSNNLSDWYDVTSVKTSFPPMLGVTQYKGLVVGHDDNGIYFSDIGLGGSSEMISGSSSFAPFGAEFGKITAVCGCEDFLLISRERRNFVLRGDIAGSFSLSECDLPVTGAYNSRACTNAWSGQIMFVNRTGIFSVNSTGNITELSAPIRDLFISNNIDNNLFNKSVFKTPAQLKLSSTLGSITKPPQDGSIFQFAVDPERGFVFFLSGARETIINNTDPLNPVYSDPFRVASNILVLDTNDNSWYEWEVPGCTSIEAYISKLYTFGADCKIEDGVLRNLEKQILATQYMTEGEPSLQKQVTQIKMYGSFNQNVLGDRGCFVKQQNDWEAFSGAKVTDTLYTPPTATQYNHKQRLNSSKPMATSIILESNVDGGSFILEGMEVEGTAVQQGVKQ